MKRRIVTIVLALSLTSCVSGTARPVVGDLQDPNKAWRCGCSFSRAGTTRVGSYVFAHPYGTGPAWMNIRGKDVELTLVNPVGDSNEWSDQNPPGTKLVYQSVGIKVTVNPREVIPCSSDACESSEIKGKIVVEVDGKRSVVGVTGGCGC